MQRWANKARTSAAAGRRSPEAVAGLTAFAATFGLSQAEGGYFPRSWGVAALGLLWVVAMALVFRRRVAPSRFELAFLGGLGALVGWIALSSLWSVSVPQTMYEIERALVYVAVVAAVLLTGRRGSERALAGAVLAGIVVVCAYGLAERLLPDVLGAREARRFDAVALYEPLGYSNALGSVAAVGALLAIGFAARGIHLAVRAASAAAVVPLVAALSLSLSRGALIAFAVGLVCCISLDPARRSLLVVLASLLPFATAAVVAAWQSPALVERAATAAEVASQGHRLAFALALISAAAAGAFALYERRTGRFASRRTRASLVGLLTATAAVLLVVLFVVGSPPEGAYTEFRSKAGPSREGRLLNVSGGYRTAYWSVGLQAAADHPTVGLGAGTFGSYWRRHRSVDLNVQDAHNLYIETLAELGPVGLALLLFTLGTPLAAALRTRAHPLVPVLAGAYAVYLVQASVDWFWEMAAVTVVALLCGAALTIAARDDEEGPPLRPRVRLPALAAVTVAGLFSFVALIGNSALEASERALAAGDLPAAEAEARKAVRWTPWASESWHLLGLTHLAGGRGFQAQASFEEAIARDPGNWLLWYDQGRATEGSARRRAFARAYALNPIDVRQLGAAS